MVVAFRRDAFDQFFFVGLGHPKREDIKMVCDTLEKLWREGHIYPCSLPGCHGPNGSFIKVHVSTLAWLAHAGWSLMEDSTFTLILKAINESLMARSEGPCECVGSSPSPTSSKIEVDSASVPQDRTFVVRTRSAGPNI